MLRMMEREDKPLGIFYLFATKRDVQLKENKIEADIDTVVMQPRITRCKQVCAKQSFLAIP